MKARTAQATGSGSPVTQAANPPQSPITDIDERYNAQITGQIMLDIVHDFDHPQACVTLVKKSDQHPSQLRATEQHEKQRAEKNKNLADRRRDNENRRLNECS